MQDDHDQVKKLRLLPKPEGFDLRDKRSDKSNCAMDWTPADALYDAQKFMDGQKVAAVAVFWFSRSQDNALIPHMRFAGPTDLRLKLLITELGREMGWDRK